MELFIFIPSLIAFLLALYSTRERFLKKFTTANLVGNFIAYNLGILFYFIILLTVVGSFSEDPERGMIFIIPTFGSLIVIVETTFSSLIAMFIFRYWKNKEDENMDESEVLDSRSWYYKYPVTFLILILAIISVIIVPFLVISGYTL